MTTETAPVALADIPTSPDECDEVRQAAEAQGTANEKLAELSQRKSEIDRILNGEELVGGCGVDGRPSGDDPDGIRELRYKETERRRLKNAKITNKILAGGEITISDVDDRAELDLRKEFAQLCKLQRAYSAAAQKVPSLIDKGRDDASKRYLPMIEPEYHRVVQQLADTMIAFRQASLAEDRLRHKYWQNGWRFFPGMLRPMPSPSHVTQNPNSPDSFTLWIRECVEYKFLPASYLKKVESQNGNHRS